MIITLLIWGIIIAVGIGMVVMLFYGIVALFMGASAGVGAGANAVKNKRFYDDCIKRGFTEPNPDNKKQINLVGDLHHIKDGYELFVQMYNKKNAPPKEKKPFKFTPVSIGALIGLVVGCIGMVVFWYYKYTTDWTSLDYSITTFIFPGILGAIIGAIGGGVIGFVVRDKMKIKAADDKRKRAIEEQLKQMGKK